ncbi:MAG: bifunctional diaminohydroxyphosphoribosylaminopyrimidine deaminase/5-amino-6-(5-phosphoribosylamino)uracil reductase RibD [Actinomycetota bacterium]
MYRAVRLTDDTWPHPNPRVGAVVVASDGDVVAEGVHIAPGSGHAEAVALTTAGRAAVGSTLIVTLEPCVHHGRTPPCTEAIIEAGVARVIVGALDPDPRVSGKGIASLRETGIEVVVGVAADAVRSNDPAYFHHRETGLPFVTLKIAATLDGQVAAADQTSRWITGPEARQDGHRLRAESDAVLVGAGTVISDNPRLDVRIAGYEGRQPRPVIVAGERPLPPDAILFDRDPLIITGRAGQTGLGDVEQVALAGATGVDLSAAMRHLGERGVVSLLIEGGPTLGGAALRAGLVDRVILHYGAKLAGGRGFSALEGVFATLNDAREVTIEAVSRLGPDLRVEVSIASTP